MRLERFGGWDCLQQRIWAPAVLRQCCGIKKKRKRVLREKRQRNIGGDYREGDGAR